MKKLENNLLLFILNEALFLLFLFKYNFINITLSFIFLLFIIPLIKKTKIFDFIILISLIFLSLLTIYKITNFISITYLKNYPIFIIIFSLLLASFLIIKKGFQYYIKIFDTVSYFIIFFKILIMILMIPLLDIHNFDYNSLLTINYKQIISALFLFTLLIYLINNEKKICLKSHIFSLTNLFILQIFTLLVLGNKLFYIYTYPYINSLRQIKYLTFFERMEGLLSFNYLFDYFFLLSFYIFNIKKIFNNFMHPSQQSYK